MRIVIDIDNTLVDYRQIIKDSLRKLVKDSNEFFLENNFKNTKSIKSQIKDKFGDDIWQEIQGLIYSHDGLPIKFFENAEKAILLRPVDGLPFLVKAAALAHEGKSIESLKDW